MQRSFLVIAVGVAIAVVGWYLFRPELLFINHTVHEGLPGAVAQQTTPTSPSLQILSQGRFHSVAHDTKGVAMVYKFPDGKRVLRFTDFETSHGPDVQVYLVAAADARNNETVTKAGFVHLGALKGNIGDQNYDLPANVDLNTYRAVTIWCRRFSVNFGTAPLMQQRS
jgi:hypothetical protein